VSSDRPTLKDFDAGYERPEPEGEDDVKLRLTRWFEQNGCDVYWDEDKPFGRPTFSSDTGGREIADLLVVGEWDVFVIEVKDGRQGGGTVRDGTEQLLRQYWLDWAERRTTDRYRTGGGAFCPDVFLIATQFSADGSLFERGRDKLHAKHSAVRDNVSHVPYRPDWEYVGAEIHIRDRWDNAKRLAADVSKSREHLAGFGAVLSGRLDSDRRPVHIPRSATPPLEREPAKWHEPRALYWDFGADGNRQNWRAIE
jgi:hypothetical protein